MEVAGFGGDARLVGGGDLADELTAGVEAVDFVDAAAGVLLFFVMPAEVGAGVEVIRGLGAVRSGPGCLNNIPRFTSGTRAG